MNKKEKEDLIKKLEEGYNIKGDFQLVEPTMAYLIKKIIELENKINQLEMELAVEKSKEIIPTISPFKKSPYWDNPVIGDIDWMFSSPIVSELKITISKDEEDV